ncbi:hypothetical protein BS78_01G256100 [Paspalum vaginatum]|nr:hypothetical protein BS78_01G256100 [Paspalum vaginatum]
MYQLSSGGNRRSLAASATLLLLLLAAAAATADAAAAAAATLAAPAAGAAGCYNDIVALRSTCSQYVQDEGPMVHPSPHCCATVRGIADATCVCDHLSSLDHINLDKVFYVAGQCGVAIPWYCGGQ